MCEYTHHRADGRSLFLAAGRERSLLRMSATDPQLESWRRQSAQFRWEPPEQFNFGRDVVDVLAADGGPALLWRNAAGDERKLSFADTSTASNRAAHLLHSLGVRAGDAVILMLPRVPEWHVMLVGLLKLGALAIPSSTILRPKGHRVPRQPQRGRRGHRRRRAGRSRGRRARRVPLAAPLPLQRERRCRHHAEGWQHLGEALAQDNRPTPRRSAPRARTNRRSSTTRRAPPAHRRPSCTRTATPGRSATRRNTGTHVQPGERLWTTSDTGWAKAAYGVIFGPWSVGAEVVLYDGRFDARRQLDLLEEFAPNVFCAPPTEFRMLVKEDLAQLSLPALRECVSAGEPLNPEVIRTWRDATGLTIRDGYGQTESILLVGNYPNVPLRPGSMGLPLPGNRVEVIDSEGAALAPGEVGDIAVHGQPPGLFQEYWKDAEATARTRRGEWYVTGDRASRDEDGYFWFVGRDDDVIISAGYRIGPFEVESALIEHPAVIEAAAVAAPDPDRGAIVKAFVVLAAGYEGSPELVREICRITSSTRPRPTNTRARSSSSRALPKTVSGKIRRVELRAR